jgi:hypothetical protein
MKGPFLFVLCLLAVPTFGQQRPLVTETTETVREGDLLLDVGFDFLNGAAFPLSGLRGQQSRLGVCGVRLGLGRAAEFQMHGTIRHRLSINERWSAPHSGILDIPGDSTGDFGNLWLGTKIRFTEERGGAPAVGFRFAVELPNTSNETGLGTDETNFLGAILLTRTMGDVQVSGNVGLAILGDPLSPGSQDDLFTYGLALVYPLRPHADLVADFHGRFGPGGIGTEEQSLLRLGLRWHLAGFFWDGAGFAGFRAADPDWGVSFGLSRQFHLPF